MKLSIIICVYNTDEDYLRVALESIRNSTLRDYEICMVDDGSQRDYTALAEEFGVRLEKTPNGGILRARMHGIGMATGDYITYFDSDDTVSCHYHQAMMDVAERMGADIVINAWAFHTETSRYYCRNDSTIRKELYAEGDGVLGAFMAQRGREHSYYVTWNKVYRRALLLHARDVITASPLYQRSVCYAEDALINFYAFREAKKLCSVHTGYYFYRIHANQSVNVISMERLRSQIEAMGEVFSMMEEGISERPDREALLSDLQAWREMISRTHYSHARAGGYTELYPLIMQTYSTPRLKRSTHYDGAVYCKAGLLPHNLLEIDRAVRPLFDREGVVEAVYDKGDAYTARLLRALSSCGVEVRYSREAGCVIPKGIITLRDRVIHNDLVYAVSARLFPKGSKIRALLKRIL